MYIYISLYIYISHKRKLWVRPKIGIAGLRPPGKNKQAFVRTYLAGGALCSMVLWANFIQRADPLITATESQFPKTIAQSNSRSRNRVYKSGNENGVQLASIRTAI